MEIPLDLERRLERRWAARFLRSKRIGLKGRINRVPHPATAQYPLGRPQRKEAAALSIGLISHFVRNDLAR
jgi:hypothetical protein